MAANKERLKLSSSAVPCSQLESSASHGYVTAQSGTRSLDG